MSSIWVHLTVANSSIPFALPSAAGGQPSTGWASVRSSVSSGSAPTRCCRWSLVLTFSPSSLQSYLMIFIYYFGCLKLVHWNIHTFKHPHKPKAQNNVLDHEGVLNFPVTPTIFCKTLWKRNMLWMFLSIDSFSPCMY